MRDKDVDAQFADIIAHWDDVQSPPEEEASESEPSDEVVEAPEAPYAAGAGPAESSPAGPSPAAPSSAGPSSGGPSAAGPASPAPSPTDPPRSAVNPPFEASWQVWRGGSTGPAEDEAEVDGRLDEAEDDEHFEPGPLAPLPPQEDLQFWGIIVGLVAGPLLLLWLVLFRPDVSDWWTFLALGLTAGGFVLLVLRQPHSRDEDDPDNGARL